MNKSQPIKATQIVSDCPVGWRVVPLSSLCKLQRGFDLTQATSEPGTVPVYSSSGVAYFTKNSKVRPPAIVTGRKGLLGKVYLPSEPFWPHDTTLWGNQFGENSPKFVAYALGAFGLEKLDAATSVPTLNRNNLHAHEIAIPERAEQEAIAEALSDAEALIEGLERLIAKKRRIKQGAMQDLLTAKRRLPGFSGEWVRCQLSDLGEISGSGVNKKIVESESPIRLLNYTDVYRNEYIYGNMLNHWVTAPEAKARRCQIQKGDVFFTPTSETPDDIARSSVSLEEITDAAYSYHVVRLRLNEADSLEFWAHAFETEDFRRQARVSADGSGTRYVITLPKFRRMQVSLPPKLERTAIGDIFGDMQAEIQALETRLVKARQIKEGMMQNLLTGRIRLV